MKKEMPTINKLMERTGVKSRSVEYNNSRTVLKNLDKPVLAYALCNFGFVVIFSNKQNFVSAVSYSVKGKYSYAQGSFAVMDSDIAENEIRENPLFAEKQIDEKNLEKASKRTKFVSPLLGEISITNTCKYSSDATYKVYRYKNGKFWIRKYNECANYRVDLGTFLREVKRAEQKKKDENGDYATIKRNELPTEVLKEMRLYYAAQEI